MQQIGNREYEKLKEDSRLLDCLIKAGVHEWDGYEHAFKMYKGVIPGQVAKTPPAKKPEIPNLTPTLDK